MKQLLLIAACFNAITARAQMNCNAYTNDTARFRACQYYNHAASLQQGSRLCQLLLDSAIMACPTFAAAWREKSVPYLKRGDFATWRKWMDEAVRLEPRNYLFNRGWCMFKFLRDYTNALQDIMEYEQLTGGQHSTSTDGVYDSRVVKAICMRETGDVKGAIAVFQQYFTDKKTPGLYDYLHSGVTRMKANDLKGALQDFRKETTIYRELADTYFYIGLVQEQLGQSAAARQSFQKAKKLFTGEGFTMYDIYAGFTDQVYLLQIEEKLRH